jgi:hypothetical protein
MSAVFAAQFSGGGAAIFAAQESYPNDNPVLQGAITVTNITTSSYDLAWPPATGRLPTTDYEVSLNGGVSWVSNGLSLSRSVVGRTQGTTDSVRVRAKVAGSPDLYSSPPLAAEVTLQSVVEPPTVAVTSTEVSGQSVTISGTYTGTVVSTSAVLPVGDPPNGAVGQGPVPVTYAGGLWEVTFDDLVPGSYSSAVITLTNTGGNGVGYGSSFEVLAIDGTPEAPVPGGGAYTKDAAESTLAVDASGAVVSGSNSVAESLAPVDAQTRTAGLGTKVTQETAVPADSSSMSVTIGRTAAEALTAADASTKVRDTDAATIEGTNLLPSDSPVAQVTVGLFTPESVVVTDTQAGAIQASNAASESFVATDAAQATYSAVNAVLEALAAADGADPKVTTGLTTVESLLAVDAVNATVQQIVGFASEVVVLTDQQFRSLLAAGAVLESADITDEVQSVTNLTATTVVEALQAADQVIRLRYPGAQVSYGPRGGARRFIVFFK